ncbi:Uncharacterised protein [Yersinia enterocolitica]|nr:Uncharacterised protein [Yersinia enterocolitica]CND09271.1 Uncharacterised protein [Yersinia enterocolitica]CND52824.1 Uncharacterised protein [Yersinia enterocolitica]CNE55303.1 Uncharacterised protein [Yersinia enterocolitica]CNF81722.1 Uncharacterised protein [Yersinia enterocolitica]
MTGIGLPLAVFDWPCLMNNRLPFFTAAIAPYCFANRVIKLPSDSLVWSIWSTVKSDMVLFKVGVSLLRSAIILMIPPIVVLW